MWAVFLQAGAQYPSTLGALLEPVLGESMFLTHADYADAGVTRTGRPAQGRRRGQARTIGEADPEAASDPPAAS